MTEPRERWIRIVVQASNSQPPENRKLDVLLPAEASIADLLEELKTTRSPLYEEVRGRVLRLAGDVLAFGREHQQLLDMRDQLANGGPVVIPDLASEHRI